MKRIMVFMVIAGVIFILPFALHAQTAAELEAVLGTQVVTCAQAAMFVCAGSATFEEVVAKGWLKNSSPDDPITMGKLSLLMMKAFNMKGGMMYSITKAPRYAYRTMVSRNFIQGASDPAMTVSGERFLLILGKVLSAEGEKL